MSLFSSRYLLPVLASIFSVGSLAAAEAPATPAGVGPFLEDHCASCHDADTKKGGLDLDALQFNPADPKNLAGWVKVHDRVEEGEMPPKKKAQPEPAERSAFLKTLAAPLIAADRAQETVEGRATWRRLNRYEYENSLRDLLQAPWLQIKDMLPEDGEAYRFNKIGDALDISHVQMARYLGAADYALRQVLASQPEKPASTVTRYYTRDQKSFAGKMKYTVFNNSPERATFPVLGTEGQPDVRASKAPLTVGAADPKTRELEAMGVVASCYEPLDLRFGSFNAPRAGHYKLRFAALSVWVGPGPDAKKWWRPNLDVVSRGRRPEPVTIYAETPPRLLRHLGTFDATPDADVRELDVWLLAGETIRPDASRLFRSRPPNYHNPLAEKDGQPGVAYRWMEVEGPLIEEWPSAGHRLLFGDLPIQKNGKTAEVVPNDPAADAERLLRKFVAQADRRAATEEDIQRYLGVINGALKAGSNFTDAMIAGYSAVLCSPAFVCLEQKPGRLDDFALAERLSYFLWNSAPDQTLRAAAARGELHQPTVLRAQTERLLADAKSQRFVDAFLDYWLDLRKMNATSPDGGLYNDYYLDDLLIESATDETRLFFAELLAHDLPARNIVASDFAMLNERLAVHYGLWAPEKAERVSEKTGAQAGLVVPVSLPAEPSERPVVPPRPLVDGVTLRRVALPPDSPRGGLMTQASVLKVTANGTTTSPVLRGVWVMERILGKPVPPPPASVPSVEPDIRGAKTIREQLDKHRSQESCAACHAKIDPAGFALENFDVFGGWRDQYRALGDGEAVKGIGKNGQPFAFHLAQPIDAGGTLPDGRKFANIFELKRLLLADERQIARNLARQLTVYATGAPVRFADRPEIEAVLNRTAAGGFGVRSLIAEIVQSRLFQEK